MRALTAAATAVLGAIPGLAITAVSQLVTGGGEVMLELGLLSSLIAVIGSVVGGIIGWRHSRWWDRRT